METANGDQRQGGPEAHNVLVVLNEVVTGNGVGQALIDHLAGQTVRVMVVAPALVESALDHEMGQIDGAIEPAQRRLEYSLKELRQLGVEAAGEVGDADPILAISDELQKFPADEIVLISHGGEDRAYAERGLLERAHHDFPLPITQLTVTRPGPNGRVDLEDRTEVPAGDPELIEVEHTPAEPGRASADLEISENFPPLRTRDVVAMVYGIGGSLALVIIAAASAINDPGTGIEGNSAAKMLIAIAALLVNGGHAVALIFFQSLRYEGMFERFASRFTIIATTIALLVTLFVL